VPPPKPQVAPGGRAEELVLATIEAELGKRLGTAPKGSVWIGDDAAVVESPRGPLLFTTDAVVAGVHADLAVVGLDDFGWKAMTAAVSDIAAMGGTPSAAVVTYCQPSGTDVATLTRGVAEAAEAYRCPVVGGDLSESNELMVSVAVIGTLDGAGGPVLRSGARPGDVVMVTGPCGASAGGLRHLRAAVAGSLRDVPGEDRQQVEADVQVALASAYRRPWARPAAGRAARAGGASAMIDVSDGFSLDADRMARASGVGLRLDAVPVAAGATLDDALGGGEDYELVLTAQDTHVLHEAFASADLPLPITVGTCVANVDERTLGGARLPVSGWQHRL
jgi:thiamine-monophosphate kinase